MSKRILLAVTFVVALSAVGFVGTSKAAAHGCGYGGGYYANYGSYYGYPAYPVVRRAYYPPAYPAYYRGFDRHHHHHHRHSGLTLSFGF